MSDINFLTSNKEIKKANKPEDNGPVVTWTSPGALPGKEKNLAKRNVEDIFADTENATEYLPGRIGESVQSTGSMTKNNLFSAIKNIFFKNTSSGKFKKDKEELRDYHDALRSENAARGENNRHEGGAKEFKKEASGKPYFRRDQWQAPNVIKTNLIQKEINSALDWRDNINLLMLGVVSACLLVVLAYLGLELKESFAAQKNQKIVQDIQDVKMEIVGLKNGLGDIDTFQKKLTIANSLLGKHIYWTNFFKFWEDNLLKNVYFSGDFSGGIDGEYSFSALTDTYTDAANQIRLLRGLNSSASGLINELTIAQADYSNADKQRIEKELEKSGAESVVAFGLKIKMDPKIFYKEN